MVRCRGTEFAQRSRASMRHVIKKEVGQITHNSIIDAEISCDRFRLRVKSEPFIGRPIGVDADDSGRRRSNHELITDSHSRRVNAEDHAPKHDETPRSWGTIPAGKPTLSAKQSNSSPTPERRTMLRRFSCARNARGSQVARRAEFISVSGQCAASSALSSDMRIKRISGGVAATEHLRAPMNSPTGGISPRAGFPSVIPQR